MPLYQRLPKRGFNSRRSKKLLDKVNIGEIQKLIDAKKILISKKIDIDVLRNVGLINKNAMHVKLLRKETLPRKLKFKCLVLQKKQKMQLRKLVAS